MQIEDVARVGLAARRTAHQQRHLPIGPGVLRQVVVHDERVLLAVAEVLAHGATGERRDVLGRRGIRRPRDHHDGVLHRAVLLESRDDLRDR